MVLHFSRCSEWRCSRDEIQVRMNLRTIERRGCYVDMLSMGKYDSHSWFLQGIMCVFQLWIYWIGASYYLRVLMFEHPSQSLKLVGTLLLNNDAATFFFKKKAFFCVAWGDLEKVLLHISVVMAYTNRPYVKSGADQLLTSCCADQTCLQRSLCTSTQSLFTKEAFGFWLTPLQGAAVQLSDGSAECSFRFL